MKKKNKVKTENIVIRRRQENIGVVLPAFRREIACLLSSEDAKVSSSKILSGSVALISLGLMTQRAAADHVNNHSSVNAPLHGNAHGNSSMPTFHANLGTAHSSDAACHLNTVAGQVNVIPHINTIPHTNAGNLHSNTTPSSGALNVHTSINQAVSKGAFHNNGSQGKHTAQLGHNNLLAAHVNRPADHANAAPHVNAGTAAVSGIGGHTNVNTGHSNAPHCNNAGHFSATPNFNNHMNTHNSAFTGHANDTHASHSSHGQW